jgi:hypothetical protein
MLAYCRNCWTIELPWLDCPLRPDEDCAADEDDEEALEEGLIGTTEVAEAPGNNEIDMARPPSTGLPSSNRRANQRKMQKAKSFKELGTQQRRQNRLIRGGEKKLPGRNFQRSGRCLNFECQE